MEFGFLEGAEDGECSGASFEELSKIFATQDNVFYKRVPFGEFNIFATQANFDRLNVFETIISVSVVVPVFHALFTWHAFVGSLKVGHKVMWAGHGLMPAVVRHLDEAVMPT